MHRNGRARTEGMSTPVSVLIIAKNEEKHIARCLASLTWADEIVLVDGESTDQTATIAEDSRAPWAGKLHFIRKPWQGFQTQRTFALQEAKNDWVLVVDADEQCSPELAAKIQSFFATGGVPPRKAYKVRRIEYFLGKPIHHGIWNPSYQDRFFNRLGVKYVNEIHEYPLFPEPAHDLHEPLHHSPDFAPEKFLEKMNRYTSIEARDRVRNGQRTNGFRLIFAFPAMFLKNYFYYSAYKDGIHGFVISILEGISRAVRHVKIWQYSRELENAKR
jgi:glycosyltransferase involved in cell wall biosynthesis